LNENVGAVDVVLTSDELAMLDAVLAPGQVSGARYSAMVMATVDRKGGSL
jgi:hypothetical protein